MSEEKKEGMLPEENPSAPKKPEGFFTPLKQKKAESQWVSSDAPSAPKEEDNSQHTTETENHQVSSVEEKAPSAGPEQKSGNPQNPGVQGTASVQNQPGTATQNPQAESTQWQYHPTGPSQQGQSYPPPYGRQVPPQQYQQGTPPPPYQGGTWQGYHNHQSGGAWQPGAPYQNSQNMGQGRPPYGGQPPYPPYGGNGVPYPPQYPPYIPPQNQPKNRGFKIFMGILIALLVIFVVGLFSSSLWSAFNTPIEDSTTSSQQDPFPPESSNPEEIPELPETSGNAVPAPDGEVVNPNSSGVVLQSKPTGSELEATEVYSKVAPSIVCILTKTQTASGIGSGIIATKDGYIFTNSHVIDNSQDVDVTVLLHNGDEYKAAIVGFDKVTDLAVLKIDASGLSPAEFGNSDDLVVGEVVYAIGNPSSVQYASSMTNGIVSGLNRPVSYSNENNMTYIQTNAAISPGNSGGALVNAYGQVVGITSSKISGVSYEGLNFAIPTARAKTILDDLMSSGYVSGRPRLGISGRNVYNSFGVGGGIEIASIEAESPLSGKAQAGDIITKVDGEEISTMDELYQILGLHKPGDEMVLTLNRNGQEFDVTITLLEDKGETQVTPEQTPVPVQ